MSATLAIAGASAAISLWSSFQKMEAQDKELAANIKAEGEKRKLESKRKFQSFMLNTSRVQDQRALDTINTRIAASRAEDELELYKAGTNLSGASIDELDNKIQRDAHRKRQEFKREAAAKQTQLRQNLEQRNANDVATAGQARGTPNQTASAFINAAGAGLRAGGPDLFNGES